MSQYIVIGPDGKPSEPVELSTLQSWASAGQLPAHAPVITPEGTQTAAGEIRDLQPALAHANRPHAYQAKGTKMMPSENPAALWGYYLGICSMLPICGMLIVPFALTYSIRGKKVFEANPSVYGKTHATVGLVTGLIGLVINLSILAAIVWGSAASSSTGNYIN